MTKAELILNKVALDNPLYNPDYSQEVIDLVSLMENGPEDEETLQEYIEQINSLPITNAFSAVLTNPRQCDIEEYYKELNEYNESIFIIRSHLINYPEEYIDWDEGYADIEMQIQETNSFIEGFDQHTNRVTSNLPSLVGMAQTAMGIATSTSKLANPCVGVPGFFGSLLDAGKSLINIVIGTMKSLASFVKSVASDIINGTISIFKGFAKDVLGEISNVVGPLKAQASELMKLAMDEVAKFAKALLGQLRIGLAGLLNFLKLDPCLAGLVGAVAGSAASGILKL